MERPALLTIVLAVAACSGGAVLSSRDAGDACSPPLESCDAPHPKWSQLDTTRACLTAPVELTDVCNTTVNKCAPSAGVGNECAIAPDGGLFVAWFDDNHMLTAKGWRFVENEYQIPFDQLVTSREEQARCFAAYCAPACPGAEPTANQYECDGGYDAHRDAAGE